MKLQLTLILVMVTLRTVTNKRLMVISVDKYFHESLKELQNENGVSLGEKSMKHEKNNSLKSWLKNALKTQKHKFSSIGSQGGKFTIKIQKQNKIEKKVQEEVDTFNPHAKQKTRSQALKHLQELEQMKAILDKMDMMMKSPGKWTRV